mmetsp:Transcript_1239/g.2142  ORF Transcript_1239/g.2142 Transcript_1239/m.2142 type:complete len:112 (-) Transcript_1239:127-462(-)|eukprot:CAMPEP_0169122928 /NCGR_PEP_ID=MMETSP1015-20121227/33504_1 /TAXON_ID=342587 /ORGANISM="Karlodinium micrum, Strain CCMP2283" /LENGTH=111 /DNA_ID=CAMNT_0009186213 /DNA_START=20 /DNA_END=355 /DNA_ORIENTATION=+
MPGFLSRCFFLVALSLLSLMLGPQEVSAAGPGGLPPWWILNGVKPAGPKKDMGSYSVVTFSPEQQEQFYVDETGKPNDKEKFSLAIKEYKAKKELKKKERVLAQTEEVVTV